MFRGSADNGATFGERIDLSNTTMRNRLSR
jgi:hypothetical protein